jgi:hypothetical protein
VNLKKLLPLVALFALVLPAQAFAAPKPRVNFSQNAYAVAENAGVAHITVFRKGNSKRVNQTATVDYATSDGTAKAGTDYSAASGTLTFAPGVTSQTFNVPIINNSVIDGARTVNLKLSHPTASGGRAMLGFPSTATLVIADDDGNSTTGPTFQMAAASDIVGELDGMEPVLIVRSGDLSSTASVNYATADGSAVTGSDYTAMSGTASFTAGSGTDSIMKEVDVPILHNSSASSPATRDFTFNLTPVSNTTGQLGSPSSEDVTIVNVDGTPTLQFSSASYSVNENGGSATLTVIASGEIAGTDEVDVDYATADGTAINGVNYTSSSDTLQFFAGDVAASFDVPVMADGLLGDKYFTASLSNPTNTGSLSPALADPSTATVNVLNTDQPGSSGSSGGAAGGDQGNRVVLGSRAAGCGLIAKATKAQKLLKQKGLKLQLRVGQRCAATITTTIKQLRPKSHKKQVQIVRALRKFSAKKTSLTLQPGKAKTVTVKFTKKTLKAITKALRARNKLVATVTVSTRDSASKVTRKTLKITIRR